MDYSNIINLALILQIFVLLNPLSSVPLLISAYRKKMDVKIIAYRAVIIAFLIAVSIVFIGPFLFNLFGITINSLRVAGGVILFLLGLSMVRPKESEDQEVNNTDSLISLIATPLLTGPAVISFITIKTYELGKISVMSNLILAFILVGLTFVVISLFVPKINEKVVGILSRILGLFLTAVAIEMIAAGVIGIFQLNV